VLEAMTSAVTKMAYVLSSQKNTSHGWEKLSVPKWDGIRKSYATWKHKFHYWMLKYKQDKDEQLQRLRKALPQNLFLVRSSKAMQNDQIGVEISRYRICRSKKVNGYARS